MSKFTRFIVIVLIPVMFWMTVITGIWWWTTR